MKFKRLTYDDYHDLKPFFVGQPYRICEYSLPALIAWQTSAYQPWYAIADDALIIAAEFPGADHQRHLVLPIAGDRRFPPETLCRLAGDLGHTAFSFVPGDYVAAYGVARIETCFHLTEQTENEDYVYRTRDLAELKGNRYAAKRNLIRQFKRQFPEPGRIRTEAITAASVPECIAFLEAWCLERDCDADEEGDLACEKKAILHTLSHIGMLDVKSLLVRLDDRVSAFAVGTGLTPDMGVLHFEKAFTWIKGLYQYVDQLCARTLFSGYRYINKESDMGIAGLARAKKSYHPVMRVKSYALTLK